MARFKPFPGVRYRSDDGRIDDLVAPPYDVIGPDEQAALEARDAHNAVRVELPREDGDRSRYDVAAELFARWRAEGVLVQDDDSFYVYRMSFRDERGEPRETVGVLGALELSAPGEGGIYPHERTTPKDKADRLDLLRATKANLSPIWGLSTAEGLSDLCGREDAPDATATDGEGNVHSLWRVTDPSVQHAISAAVGDAPVVIADGHHRFEVGNAYRAERRAEAGSVAGDHDWILAYIVELAEEQLSVRAIHRLLNDVDEDTLLEVLGRWFEVGAGGPVDIDILERMDAEGGLALVTAAGARMLLPRAETVEQAEHDLDSSRLDLALAELDGVGVRFQHGVDEVRAAVAKGDADAGVLLRPATVSQIAAIGRGGERMPPKTTFFYPKPRTGMVFREVAG